MQERPMWVSTNGHAERPNVARLFDFYLGGAHNFAVDREFAALSVKSFPVDEAARTSRSFLQRAVRHCVARGITQFLDLGSGIPTAGNVHEVAERLLPSPRVVYVDNDPVTVAHGRTMLKGHRSVAIVGADVRDPDAVLAAPETVRLLDLDEPVALLMVGILPYLSAEDRPADLVAKYREAIAPGSHLVVSHLTADREPALVDGLAEMVRLTGTSLTPRDAAEVAGLFTGFDLVDPGLVMAGQWHADTEDTGRASALAYGAVGIKH
ncbi:SAM-dependent methyltransferase [Umezawaea tangerina]|uniref:S-adenosyl methyltransferase n=1 Tax=Umezawaea tangerina TaxID=84725 RepID=A0A2T0TE02_9PSEU|nr:SAM-dependent methyltransferase [Umezawaea tangerina]PRY43899.1 S-adenosyl methyltransferase [Umezawaea tangerina]